MEKFAEIRALMSHFKLIIATIDVDKCILFLKKEMRIECEQKVIYSNIIFASLIRKTDPT